MFALVAALVLQTQTGVSAVPPTAPDSLRQAAADSARRDSTRRRERPAPRRAALTPELERTAFADTGARTLLLRARAARLRQESALRAYDAKAVQRISAWLAVRGTGRGRLLMREESAARVRWSRDVGVWMDVTGARSAIPVADGGKAEIDVSDVAPIPYYPGRESLWIPTSNFGMVKAEVDERELVHPLALGAEAYYRYRSGGAMTITLPNGNRVRLRELEITARRPDWKLFVGSFWFDVGSGQLVRAAYRMSMPLDVWELAEVDMHEAVAAVEADTALRRRAPKEWRERMKEARKEEDVPGVVKGMLSPARAEISAITIEYELHDGRFWMLKSNTAEGMVQMGFMRLPIQLEERFRYASVNGDVPLPALPPAGPTRRERLRAIADTLGVPADATDEEIRRAILADSTRRDALPEGGSHVSIDVGIGGGRAKRDSLPAAADSALAAHDRQRGARAQCDTASTFVRVESRHEGAIRYAVRVPCDTASLATSPDLPKSIYDDGEELFGKQDLDALQGRLTMGLQPGMVPMPPRFYWNLGMVRYNRVEGLSSALGVRASPGGGWMADAQFRLGIADLEPNVEGALTRSNGRLTLGAGIFRRLMTASDRPTSLSFGSSVSHFLFARDEGFYYRTWGAELTGQHGAPGGFAWRVFAERQESADVETQLSLPHVFAGTRFLDNIRAREGTITGAAASLGFARGLDPRALRLAGELRGEVAAGDFDYARGAVEATLSRPIAGRVSGALTGSGGWSGGALPPQRAWYLGGAQTVRGQTAGTQAGDAFWLGRAELGWGGTAVRPTVFGDIGWAGSRGRLARHPGRPLSGAGVGASLLDGIVRLDLSRGVQPEKGFRLDLYLDARF